MENAIKQPRPIDTGYLSSISFKVQYALEEISNVVRSSDLNVAMVACLNHAEFSVIDPLIHPITREHHKSPRINCEHVGVYAMAHIAQAGIASFDLDLLRKQKYTTTKLKNKKEKQDNANLEDVDEDMASDVDTNDVGTLSATMTSLEKDSLVPTIADLHALLKSAFSSMKKEDQFLYQSILKDIQVLQPWTRKLDYAEFKAITRVENAAIKFKNRFDDASKEGEESDEEEDFGKVSFQQIGHIRGPGKKNPISVIPSTPVTTAAIPSISTPSSKKNTEKNIGTNEDDMDSRVSMVIKSTRISGLLDQDNASDSNGDENLCSTQQEQQHDDEDDDEHYFESEKTQKGKSDYHKLMSAFNI